MGADGLLAVELHKHSLICHLAHPRMRVLSHSLSLQLSGTMAIPPLDRGPLFLGYLGVGEP